MLNIKEPISKMDKILQLSMKSRKPRKYQKTLNQLSRNYKGRLQQKNVSLHKLWKKIIRKRRNQMT